MHKILILYFSGVGATKKVAELMNTELLKNNKVDIFSIEHKQPLRLDEYEAFIIGSPVYHGAPAKVLLNYIDSLPPFNNKKPAFIFNTRGLCALNTNNILSKHLSHKNIYTTLDKEYRGPASDGVLITPSIKRFYKFEKDLERKIKLDCLTFLKLLNDNTKQGYIPRFRLGSIVNAPNKLAGQYITLKIHLHKDKCIKCNKCINQCPYKAFTTSVDNYPQLSLKSCENCYRCIHHCPTSALSLCKHKTPKKLLKY